MLSRSERGAALIVAAIAWLALALQFEASCRQAATITGAAWTMLLYFTILTNLVVALQFTGLAAGWAWTARPRRVAGTTLAILLVGIVYALLLRGTLVLRGNAVPADFLLHQVTPVLVPLFWLVFIPKGELRWRDPLLWAAFPLTYLAYALVRGGMDGHYPYHFIDVGRIGWVMTIANATGIAFGYFLAGYAIIWLDYALSRKTFKAHR